MLVLHGYHGTAKLYWYPQPLTPVVAVDELRKVKMDEIENMGSGN